MILNADSFLLMGKIPKAIKRVKTTIIKTPEKTPMLQGTAAQRKEQSAQLVRDALIKHQPVSAAIISDITKLTVNCVRDRLNELFNSGAATKKKEKTEDSIRGVFYFSLVSEKCPLTLSNVYNLTHKVKVVN